MAKTSKIALSTAVENVPNVRIVNFCCDTGQPSVLYFASDRDNRKVKEFSQNNNIAFTSVPEEGILHVRSLKAIVQKSRHTIYDVAQLFESAIPGYDKTISAIGNVLDVFEIHISEAMIVTGFDEPELIKF